MTISIFYDQHRYLFKFLHLYHIIFILGQFKSRIVIHLFLRLHIREAHLFPESRSKLFLTKNLPRFGRRAVLCASSSFAFDRVYVSQTRSLQAY